MRYVYANYLSNVKIERRNWLENFNLNLPQFAAQFNISAAEQTRLENGLIWIDRGLLLQSLSDSFSKSITAFSDEMDTDETENDAQEPQFQPGPPPSVPGRTGTFEFVVKLVNDKILKPARPPQTVLDALGLNPLPAPSATDPLIRSLVAGPNGHVEIAFSRGGSPQVIVESRRNGGGWELLKEVAGTHWPDTRPNAVPGQSEAREYRVRYSNGMQGVGNYSPVRGINTQG